MSYNISSSAFEQPLLKPLLEQLSQYFNSIQTKFYITALSDTDALITALNKKIAKKQQIKQGTMQQLLTGKKRLPGFSGEWVEKKLGDSLSIKHGRDQKQIECASGKFPILGTGGVIGYTDTPIYSKESVLIGRKGTIDKPNYYDTPFWTVDTLFYSEINSGYDAKFLFYIFNLIDWYLYNEASGVPSLNAKVIESIKVNIPNKKNEQTAIAQILTDMDNEITQLEKKRDKYVQLKAGMMQVLLTGKVRLVNQFAISNSEQKSKVIELNLTQPKAKKHSKEFDEAVIISFLVDKFGTEDKPLSRFLYTKYSYLIHRKHDRSTGDFQKFASGPYNPKSRYNGPEKIGHENRYFKQLKNDEGYDAFVSDENTQEALTYFNQWYVHDIQFWIEQFRNTAPWDLETLTTVDMAVFDLEKKNIEINVENIKIYLASIPKWKAKLNKPQFADSKIQMAINKSRELFS